MFVAKSAPPVSVTPFEDASPPVETPPVKVEVAEVVAEINGTINPVYIVEVGAWKFPTDWTDRIEPGVVVPIPILPELSTMKTVEVASAKEVGVSMAKRGNVVTVEVADILNLAKGVEVPIPKLPPESSTIRVKKAVTSKNESFPAPTALEDPVEVIL